MHLPVVFLSFHEHKCSLAQNKFTSTNKYVSKIAVLVNFLCFFMFWWKPKNSLMGAKCISAQKTPCPRITSATLPVIWHSITHLEASSAQPLPSSALAWAAEQTQPSMPLWPGSADPEPHRFPQTHLHLSSWPEKEGKSHCQNKCIIVKK